MIKNKRILLVGNTAWSMFNFRMGVAKYLREAGYDVIIIAPYDHTSEFIISEGFRHVDILIDNKGVSPKRDIRMVKDLLLLYRNLKPGLIVHYTIKPNIYGGIAARLAGVKVISFVTGLGSMFIKRTPVTRLIEVMYKTSFFFSEKVWFLNEDDHRFFTERRIVSIRKAEILPGEGINTSEYVSLHENIPDGLGNKKHFKFLYLGRILKDKGILELVEATKILKHKYSNFDCQVLGFIDALNPSSISESTVRDWVEDGIINYLGQASDVRPYIQGADCIVLPSYREGVSRTLLEAASMQKPIITTDVTGCRDIVEDNLTGFLCEVMNHKDLAKKMEAMLNLDDNSRKQMGIKGRLKVIREFDESLIKDMYLNAVRSLI
jgi:Glycosyltransferase